MIRLLVEAFVLILVQIITLITLFFKTLPAILRVVWLALRCGLVLSCWLYQWGFRLAGRVGVNLTRPPLRIALCISVSLVLCAVLVVISGAAFTVPVLLLAATHGLIVGAAWDQLSIPPGLIVGV
jgi:hypothetical protein